MCRNQNLLDAFGQINEDFIEEADPEKKRANNQSKNKNKNAWIKWGAMAACAMVVVGISIPMFNNSGITGGKGDSILEGNIDEPAEAGSPEEARPAVTEECAEGEIEEGKPYKEENWDVEGPMGALTAETEGTIKNEAGEEYDYATDNEPMLEIPLEKAQDIELFPTVILDGYELEESVQVYDQKVVVARFYNETLDDMLMIRIYDKEYFYSQNDDVEFNSIIYQGETNSFIYFDGDEKIIRYRFSNRDIADIEDFWDMVYSADYFKQTEDTPEIKEG